MPQTAREWAVTLITFLVAFLGPLGLLIAIVITRRRRLGYPWSVIGAAFAAALMCPGVAVPFGQTLSAGFGTLVVPLVLAFIAAWLLLVFDILTAVCAVGTYVLLGQCLTLSGFLSDLGSDGETALVAAWAVIGIAAFAYAFRSQFAAGLRRLAAS